MFYIKKKIFGLGFNRTKGREHWENRTKKAFHNAFLNSIAVFLTLHFINFYREWKWAMWAAGWCAGMHTAQLMWPAGQCAHACMHSSTCASGAVSTCAPAHCLHVLSSRGPVANRPWSSSGLQLRGWGPLF